MKQKHMLVIAIALLALAVVVLSVFLGQSGEKRNADLACPKGFDLYLDAKTLKELHGLPGTAGWSHYRTGVMMTMPAGTSIDDAYTSCYKATSIQTVLRIGR